MAVFARIFGWLDEILRVIETWIAIACLVAIVVVTALGVFFRYVLNDPLVWSNGAGIVAMMWLTFIGGSLLFKTDDHINISAVPSLLSPGAWQVLQKIFAAMILITVCLIAWQMLKLLPLQHRKEIDVLSLPRSAYGIPLMWAMLSIAVSAIAKIAREFQSAASRPHAGDSMGI